MPGCEVLISTRLDPKIDRPCAVCPQLSLTFSLALVAVPINTLFGISVALLIARNEFPGKARADWCSSNDGCITWHRCSGSALS